MQDLNDFAEYVEQQQNLRYPAKPPAAGVDVPVESTEHHAELDELFDNLDLGDVTPRVPLRQLLLATDDDSLQKLQAVVTERIEEGFGETVFEIGFENNGESMQLTLDEWKIASARLAEAAKGVRADCQLLLTKYVGGEMEAASTATSQEKFKYCSGKILVRQNPLHFRPFSQCIYQSS